MLHRPHAGADLAVHRARVGWRATRDEVARWLEAVPVEALGLGPDELFYVPHLRIRVPLRRGAGPGGVPDRVIAELRALLARAESGWDRGFVPGCPYRFTGRASFFAWLVRLWIADASPPARRAFECATGHAGLAAWQRATVLRDAPLLVATLARLAANGLAARWIARFEPADFAIVHRAIEESYAVRLDAPPEPIAAAHTPSAISRAQPRAEIAFLQQTRTALTTSGNEWFAIPPPARVLLLAAAALARDPSRPSLRTPRFVTAIAHAAEDPHALLHPAEPAPGPALAASGAARSVPPAVAPRTLVSPPTPRTARAKPVEIGRAPKRPWATTTPAAPAVQGQEAATRFEPQTASTPAVPSSLRPGAEPVEILAPDTAFSTGFGGLLFLVNAFTALGLYPDFTRPLGARLAPSPLRLADRIGRWRFGACYRRDPLANWIAAHCADGRLPVAWRPDPAWLEGLETAAPPRVTRSATRVTTWHPTGFPLSDESARRPRPAALRPAFRPPAHLPSGPGRWSACLALYLDARLRRLTGSGLALLAQPARIEIRDLELRVGFALDRHPIELRLAGLDRNPGWQPAEGRNIAFAFA